MSSIIAFDVSKDELVGVRMNRSGRVVDRFQVPNTPLAIGSFLDNADPVRFIGSEATGPYHVHLAEACISRDIVFKLTNPLVTKQFMRSTVRKRKTDADDAVYIGRTLLLDAGRSVSKTDLSPAVPILRTATEVINMAASLKRRRGRFSSYVAGSSQAQEQLAKAEEALRAAAAALRNIGREYVSSDDCALLESIPGIGKTLAPIIACEVRDVARFRNGKALVAYAGLDPRVRQSGTSLHHNSHITKRGSPHLRYALFLAASAGERYDDELREYYKKRRAAGKGYTEITVANSRRMAHRIFAVLKRGTPYERRSAPLADNSS